jgi:hypothetical protein
MRKIVASVVLASLFLLARGAHADELPPAAPQVFVPLSASFGRDVGRAISLRNAGIGLFAVGLTVTLVSQVLLGFAFAAKGTPGNADVRHYDLPEYPALVASSAVTIAVGNLMLGSGLVLWGTGNHRAHDAQARLRVSASGLSGTF